MVIDLGRLWPLGCGAVSQRQQARAASKQSGEIRNDERAYQAKHASSNQKNNAEELHLVSHTTSFLYLRFRYCRDPYLGRQTRIRRANLAHTECARDQGLTVAASNRHGLNRVFFRIYYVMKIRKLISTSRSKTMQFKDIDIRQLADALQKQAEIIRQAGADRLADALAFRAEAFEHAVIPVKVDQAVPVLRQLR